MSKWIKSSALILSFFITTYPVQAAQPLDNKTYLADLIKRSEKKKLSSQRYWHLLLHYKRNMVGVYTSEADGSGFFLSPNGKINPRAELEATLEKFFSNERVGTSKQQAQCAFPARYHWLKKELDFDERLLKERECNRFKEWIAGVDPDSVTLIFPSAYMNNPSSMFGHTLLRIDQPGQTEQTRILTYVINYAATVTTENPISFAFFGIVGGFKGYFSIMPYYIKVQEYSDMENRDIWEYRLNLTKDQTERMLMHAWELGNTYFDYYFFKENCSYHLLSLLEIAEPSLHLTDSIWGWTIPTDTIRLITDQPGLVAETVFRPSRSTQIQRKRETLSKDEDRLLHKIIQDFTVIQTEKFKKLSMDRQAFVLDTTYDYIRYRSVTDSKNIEKYRKIQDNLLSARSALMIRIDGMKIRPTTTPPETGHGTLKIGVGIGFANNESFEELTFRAAYHDLLDDDTGYALDSQIEFLDTRLRHFNRSGRTNLDRLTLISIISLFPIDSLFSKASWKVHAGWKSIRDDECDYCNFFDFNIGRGAAFQTHFLSREVYYVLAEVDFNVGNPFEKNYRAGAGGTVGLLADITPRWKAHAFTTYLSFPFGDQSDDLSVSLHQRYTLTKDLATRLELDRQNGQNQSILRMDFYF